MAIPLESSLRILNPTILASLSTQRGLISFLTGSTTPSPSVARLWWKRSMSGDLKAPLLPSIEDVSIRRSPDNIWIVASNLSLGICISLHSIWLLLITLLCCFKAAMHTPILWTCFRFIGLSNYIHYMPIATCVPLHTMIPPPKALCKLKRYTFKWAYSLCLLQFLILGLQSGMLPNAMKMAATLSALLTRL